MTDTTNQILPLALGALAGALPPAMVGGAYHHPAALVGALAAVGAIVGAIVGALVGARRRGAAVADAPRVDAPRVDATRIDAAQARRRICRLAAGLELARCTAGAEWGPIAEEEGDRAQILRLRESAILAGIRGVA